MSTCLLGAAVGSLLGSGLADSLGRRKAFLLDAVPLLVGPLLSATATGLTAMLAGRVITGVGIGLSSALVPLYVSEVPSPPFPSLAALRCRRLFRIAALCRMLPFRLCRGSAQSTQPPACPLFSPARELPPRLLTYLTCACLPAWPPAGVPACRSPPPRCAAPWALSISS